MRRKQALDPTSAETRKCLNDMGMNNRPSAFDNPDFGVNCQVSTPPVVCHADIIGLGGLLLTKFLHELTDAGVETLQLLIDQIQLPPHWQPCTAFRISSTTGKLMMGAEDIKHVLQIMPFALRGDVLNLPPENKQARKKKQRTECNIHTALRPVRLTYSHQAKEKYRQRPIGQGTKSIYRAFIAIAESLCYLCARTRPSGSPTRDAESLNIIHASVVNCRHTLQTNWPNEFNLPNVNTGLHYRMAIRYFGVAGLLNVLVEELMHSTYKHKAHTTSGRETLVELMQLENFRQACRR